MIPGKEQGYRLFRARFLWTVKMANEYLSLSSGELNSFSDSLTVSSSKCNGGILGSRLKRYDNTGPASVSEASTSTKNGLWTIKAVMICGKNLHSCSTSLELLFEKSHEWNFDRAEVMIDYR